MAVVDITLKSPLAVVLDHGRKRLDHITHMGGRPTTQFIADFVEHTIALVHDVVHGQRFFAPRSTGCKCRSLGNVSRSDVQAKWNALDLPIVVFLPGMQITVIDLNPETTRTERCSHIMSDSNGVHLCIFPNHGADDNLERSDFRGHDQTVFITVHANNGAQ